MGIIRMLEGGARPLVAVVLAALLPSCGLLRGSNSGGGREVPETEVVEERAANQVVGEIASVFPDEGFVLIRRYGGGGLPTDSAFNTKGPGGRTAAVRPTGERSGRFFAADVTGGAPEKGDVVVARRLPSGSLEEVTPVEERPKPGFVIP